MKESLKDILTFIAEWFGTVYSSAKYYGAMLIPSALYNNTNRIPRSPNQRHQFLFLGFNHPGKSQAIENIFPGVLNTVSTPPSKHIQGTTITQIVCNEDKNSIVEIPSLLSQICVEDNACILTGLVKYLHKRSSCSLHNQIVPTIVFITASLIDDRFEGKRADFTQFLEAVCIIKSIIMEGSASNVVLLLTHGDNKRIQNVKYVRVEKYKQVFKDVFGVHPSACLIVGESPLSVDNIKVQIGAGNVDGQKNVFHSLFVKFLEENEKYNSWSTSQINDDYLPDNTKWGGDIYKRIFDCLNAENTKQQIFGIGTGLTLPPVKQTLIEASFTGSVATLNKLFNAKEGKFYNLLHSQAKILLEDGKTESPVIDLIVGQRVFGVNCQVGVVTNTTPILKECFDDSKGVGFGEIYAHLVDSTGQVEDWEKSLLKYDKLVGKESMTRIPVDVGADLNTDGVWYYLEVNNGTSPFIANEYICYSECDREDSVTPFEVIDIPSDSLPSNSVTV